MRWFCFINNGLNVQYLSSLPYRQLRNRRGAVKPLRTRSLPYRQLRNSQVTYSTRPPCSLPYRQIKCEKKLALSYELFFKYGGEGGIRTPDTLPYTHFPGVLLQPLGHLTKLFCRLTSWGQRALLQGVGVKRSRRILMIIIVCSYCKQVVQYIYIETCYGFILPKYFIHITK